MDCHRIRERITAHRDGALPPAEADEVSAHLASCPDCASEAEALEKTLALLDAWALPPGAETPSADLAARVLAAAVARPDRRFPLRLWVAAGMAGAVVGLLAGILLEGSRKRPAPEPTAPAAAALSLEPLDLSLVEAIPPGRGR